MGRFRGCGRAGKNSPSQAGVVNGEKKGDICWRIEFLCFSPGLIGYFVLLSLRNVLLLCNRSEHVNRRA